MSTIMAVTTARRAVALADQLRDLRNSTEALQQDHARQVHVQVDNLTRTYGTGTRSTRFRIDKAQLLGMIESTCTNIVAELREMGVGIDPMEEQQIT